MGNFRALWRPFLLTKEHMPLSAGAAELSGELLAVIWHQGSPPGNEGNKEEPS